jgi:hypothetical protein
MQEKIKVTGLRAATMKINGHWDAVEVYLDTEKNKLIAVEKGKKCDGVYLSTFNAQRFNVHHHYTMQEVEGYLITGLQANGYDQYEII